MPRLAVKPYENKLLETKSDFGRKKHMMNTMRFFGEAGRLMGHEDIEEEEQEQVDRSSPNKVNRTARKEEVINQFLANKWNLSYTTGLMNARKNRGKVTNRSFT